MNQVCFYAEEMVVARLSPCYVSRCSSHAKAAGLCCAYRGA
jgi:hypothetical protein